MGRELVEQAVAGDYDAFVSLAAAAYDRLHGIARLILRDQEVASDAVQEALASTSAEPVSSLSVLVRWRACAVPSPPSPRRHWCVWFGRSPTWPGDSSTGGRELIVKSSADVLGTRGDKRGDGWHSLRLLHTDDGMGVTLTDTILDPGFDMVLWQKNHFEACYCLEGDGTIEELDKGKVHEIRPGTLYAMDDHDRHRLRARTRMRIVCTFVPALTGQEVYDADGSLREDDQGSETGNRKQAAGEFD